MTATVAEARSHGWKNEHLTTHVLAAAWVGGMFAVYVSMPQNYAAWLQEDGFIEWLTVTLFAAAAVVHGRSALRDRRCFDLLVVAFLIFVAGEEFSWGQRLLGFTPPELFLQHNRQQEFTLHNFADLFGKPKGVLIMALLGYGILLTAANATRRGQKWLRRIGATAPPVHTAVWFAAAAALLVWYPLDFTGEWVEALAGALFFLSARPTPRIALIGIGAAVFVAGVLTFASAHGNANHPAMTECARRETAALAQDITSGNAGLERLYRRRGAIHKRVYTAIAEEYLDPAGMIAYKAAGCGKSQEYVLDPWGMPYWARVSARDESGAREVQIYSMGPNRRRDSTERAILGDDVGARGTLSPALKSD